MKTKKKPAVMPYMPTITLAELMPTLDPKMLASLQKRFEDTSEMTVKRVATVSQPKVEEGKPQILIDISTRDMDRDREILLPKGCDTSEFMLSGVILDSHSYYGLDAIVGKAVQISKSDKTVSAVVEFAPTGMGATAWALAQFMPLQASVGFVPLDTIDQSHNDWAKTIAKCERDWPEFAKNRDKVKRIIRKWLLLEASIVSIPCNVHALQQDVSKQLSAGTITGENAQLCIKAFEDAIAKDADAPADPEVPTPEEPEKKEDNVPVVVKAAPSVISVHVPKVISTPRVLSAADQTAQVVKAVMEKATGKV